MKNLFRFASYGCLVASMALVSCSDDNDGPDAPNNTPAAPSIDNVFTAVTPAQVDGYAFTTNDKGQVTNIKDGGDEISIVYGTFTRATEYQAKATFTYYGEVESEVYLQFNNQGFIVNALQVYADSEDGDDTWTFKYNAEGQMIEMNRSESDEKYTITYADGNITKVNRTEEDGDSRVTTVYYTNDTFKSPIVNKANVMLYDETFDIDMDEMSPLYYAGLLGKATKNLPMKSEQVSKEGSETYTDTLTFFWEFNSKDLPVEFWSEYNDQPYRYGEVSFSWK